MGESREGEGRVPKARAVIGLTEFEPLGEKDWAAAFVYQCGCKEVLHGTEFDGLITLTSTVTDEPWRGECPWHSGQLTPFGGESKVPMNRSSE